MRPRVRPIGLIIAAILAAMMLGLVYLTQTLGSNATSSQIGGMIEKSNELRASLQTQSSRVNTHMDQSTIERRARKLKLRDLRDVLVLPAP